MRIEGETPRDPPSFFLINKSDWVQMVGKRERERKAKTTREEGDKE